MTRKDRLWCLWLLFGPDTLQKTPSTGVNSFEMRARQPVKAQMRNFDLQLARKTQFLSSKMDWNVPEIWPLTNPSWFTNACLRMWHTPRWPTSNEQTLSESFVIFSDANRQKGTQTEERRAKSHCRPTQTNAGAGASGWCSKIAFLLGKQFEHADHPHRFLTYFDRGILRPRCHSFQ